MGAVVSVGAVVGAVVAASVEAISGVDVAPFCVGTSVFSISIGTGVAITEGNPPMIPNMRSTKKPPTTRTRTPAMPKMMANPEDLCG